MDFVQARGAENNQGCRDLTGTTVFKAGDILRALGRACGIGVIQPPDGTALARELIHALAHIFLRGFARDLERPERQGIPACHVGREAWLTFQRWQSYLTGRQKGADRPPKDKAQLVVLHHNHTIERLNRAFDFGGYMERFVGVNLDLTGQSIGHQAKTDHALGAGFSLCGHAR